MQDWAWIAHRYDVVSPTIGELPDFRDHLLSRHFWSGSKLPLIDLIGREDFDMSAPHIDDQYLHGPPRRRRACRSAALGRTCLAALQCASPLRHVCAAMRGRFTRMLSQRPTG